MVERRKEGSCALGVADGVVRVDLRAVVLVGAVARHQRHHLLQPVRTDGAQLRQGGSGRRRDAGSAGLGALGAVTWQSVGGELQGPFRQRWAGYPPAQATLPPLSASRCFSPAQAVPSHPLQPTARTSVALAVWDIKAVVLAWMARTSFMSSS